jgi:hypothetical protein
MPPYVSTMILRPVRPGVAHRATDDEATGRVDQQAVALGRDLEGRRARVDDVLLDVGLESVELDLVGVLRGEHTVSTRTGRLSASYSMVTWVLPSGRR